MKKLFGIAAFVFLFLGLCFSRQVSDDDSELDEKEEEEYEGFNIQPNSRDSKMFEQGDWNQYPSKKWDKEGLKSWKNDQKKPWKRGQQEDTEEKWADDRDQSGRGFPKSKPSFFGKQGNRRQYPNDRETNRPWKRGHEDEEGRYNEEEATWTEEQNHRKQGFPKRQQHGASWKQGNRQDQQNNKENQNLQYTYEVQTHTGPTGTQQQSGFKIQATILFDRLSSSTCILKLQDPRASKSSGGGDQRQGDESKNFEQVSLESTQSKILGLPVKFNCQNGVVKRPMFDEEDEPWSMNLKRGALNMFHVNTRHVADHQSPTAKHFQAFEETVEGECQTDYSFVPVRDQSSGQQAFNVTKSVNFQNCKERPHIFYDFPSARDCLLGDGAKHTTAEEHLIHGSSTSSYAISGNIDQITIREAKTHSQYIYAPFGFKSDQIVTRVHQELKLTSSSSNGNNQKIEEPKGSQLSESGMLYSLEWDMAQERATMFGQMEHLKKLNMHHEITDIPNKVVVLVKELRKMTPRGSLAPKSTAHKTTNLLNLVFLIRQAKPQDIQEIENQLVKESQGKSKKVDNLYAQILGICGTKICINRLLHLIKQQQVSQITAIVALKNLFNVQIPSEDVVHEIIMLANHNMESPQSSYFMKQTLWLLSGSLINSLCSNAQHKFAIEQYHSKSACPSHLKHQFVHLIAKHLHSSQNWEDKLIFTKTLANAGLPESLPLLEKLIKNKNKDASWVRNGAIFALRKLARRRAGYVQGLLLPIATNSKEPSEIRLSAVKILLESNPDASVLNQLVTAAAKGHDQQVSNAIYAALNAIANSSKICDQPLIRNARLAAQSAPKTHKLPKCGETSTLNWFSIVDKLHEQSTDLEFFASYGNHSSNFQTLPKHLSWSLSALRGGIFQRNMFALGLVTTDPDKTLNHAYQSLMHGKTQGGKMGHYLREIWGRGLRHFSESDDEQFEDELETSQSQDDHFGQEAHESFKALLYTQFNDQNVGFLPINKNLMKRFLSRLNSDIRRLTNELRQGKDLDIIYVTMHRDLLVKMPTAAGLPLSVSIQAPGIVNVNGKAQVQLSGATSQDSRSTQENKLRLDLHAGLESNVIVDYQIWSPIVNHGFKAENRLTVDIPLSGTVNLDFSNGAKNVILLISPSRPSSSAEFFNMKVKPTTYANRWVDFVKDFKSVDEKPIGIKPTDITHNCHQIFISGSKICVTKTKNSALVFKSFKPAYLALSTESKNAMLKPQPLEIAISLIGSSAKRNVPFHDEQTIINKIHIIAKSGQYKASLNLACVIDPTQKASRLHAVMTSQEDNAATKMMCFNSEMVVLDPKQKLVVGNAALRWGRGSSCESTKNYVIADLSSEPQDEAQYSKNRKQCMGDRCTLNGGTSPNTYTLNINYNAPVEIRNVTNKVYQMLKHAVYDKSDVAQIDVQNPPNRIYAILDVSPDDFPTGNLILKSPTENLTVSDINLPSWFGQMSPECHAEHKNEKPHEKYTKKMPIDQGFQERPTKAHPIPHHNPEEETESYNSEPEYENEDEDYLENEDGHFEHDDESDPDEVATWHHGDSDESEHHTKPGVLKHRKNGLVEGPSWLEGGHAEKKNLQEDDEKNKKKPNWGDWLKESKDRDDDESDDNEKPGRKFGREELDKDDQRICRLDQNDQITTVGSKKYKFPIQQCLTILSKDCSPGRRFIIMVKKSADKGQQGKSSDKKELFVLLRTHKISLHKSADNVAMAKVNDVPVELKDGAEIFAPGSKNTKLNRKGAEIFIVVQELGIRVKFDGHNVAIQFSDDTARTQCGLCGQPNNKNWPDTTKSNFVDEIFAAYVVKDAANNCKKPSQMQKGDQQQFRHHHRDEPLPSEKINRYDDISSMHHKDSFMVRNPKEEDSLWRKSRKSENLEDYGPYSEVPEISDDQESPSPGYPIMGHVIIHADGGQICISTKIVPKCPQGTYAEHENEKRVPFVCLEKTSYKAQSWERKVLADQRIPELENLTPERYYIAHIPTKCLKH